ncbi:DUF397 domain-containing protein [Streptomyces clavuligerus]|uniref:DUF397 domain-containing protein n=1 Tax=Streptomyces clavuligerus TaxID=1901 RepID=B5GYM6_STRCL|nr:DUF397 domain-containing protein [Streptomyces clavuligerus]ANW20779.1 DUF397 domain-containing protein [Streptomyces clavuligerus]AXU15405.1 DUF397 domain-containing protein [Streptomyces clavuligerus]EDY51422.1 hypothetical protein SSCG_04580 [Streptomyces clavuligerus]EFG06185.1 DUF397 domain-containing protein [Streptomyces clavuligerus]MBY6305499.1 DUF397 domain-containing protein [Streptomyces clavuligerus]
MTITTDSLRWIKSSYSENGGVCVEWAPAYASATGVVPVRDSKQSTGPVLMVSAAAFAGLVDFARGAEL